MQNKKKSSMHVLIHGTLILTAAGFISRILGFFYRIFLSNTIGAEGMGIYQLIFPVYGLCNALSSASIQTAISRYVASELSHNSEKGAKTTLYAGLFLSLSFSTVMAIIVYSFAEPIATIFLQEDRCIPLLKIMAVSLPISAIHTSIHGYYYGLQKPSVPAFSQLAEQITRVACVYCFAIIALKKGIPLTPILAVYGLLIGEAASVLYCAAALSLHKSSIARSLSETPSYQKQMKKILALAIPLSLNRFMINLLQSTEAVLIPTRLRMFGLTNTEALEIYGVLTGMAMHFILFPSALTNSISVMLLPAVAKAQSGNNQKQINMAVDSGIKSSLFIGILCTGIFLLYGDEMGTLIFNNKAAGSFITILSWLCPFLYLSTTIGSILNGLEKTGIVFFHNIISLMIRILFIIFLVPKVGIIGYLLGILASQLIIAMMHIWSMKHYVSISLSAIEWIVKPIFCLASAAIITHFLLTYIPFSFLNPLFLLAMKCGLVLILYCILLFFLSKKNLFKAC